jgi:hypothetical protein
MSKSSGREILLVSLVSRVDFGVRCEIGFDLTREERGRGNCEDMYCTVATRGEIRVQKKGEYRGSGICTDI